jgi:Contact-dependent growth inhibition CdiA C-terminal domain
LALLPAGGGGARNERLSKMQTEKVWTLDEVKADWARVKCEVAYVRMIVAAHQLMKTLQRQDEIKRLAAEALKYRPDQPRISAGQSGGGQWTDGGVGSRSRGVRTAGLGSEILKRAAQKALQFVKPYAKKLFDVVKKGLQALRRVPKVEKLPSYLKPRPGLGKLRGTAEDLVKMTEHERRLAAELNAQGHHIDLITTGAKKTPDWFINGVKTEVKEVSRAASRTPAGLSKAISREIEKHFGQGPNFIVDARGQAGMTEEAAKMVIERTLGKDLQRRLKTITVLTKNGPVSMTRSFFTKSAGICDLEVEA